jgi:hypothetical protein
MNNMVFVDGRYRVPGSKYMSYTMTQRSGSRLNSSRSSKRSQWSNKSDKSLNKISRKSLVPNSRNTSARGKSSTKSLVG